MSVTTTENPVTTTLAHTLQDYEVRVTGVSDLPSPEDGWVPLTDHEAPADVENPAHWPTDERRGVPRYRPINRHLDLSQRPWGGDPVGTAFVATMFTGVFLEAVSSFFLLLVSRMRGVLWNGMECDGMVWSEN
ncbi:hypothetical protein F5Y15DRAFT_373354 [Xylariaceae sp. FL0016]|nr:hypothetical protein F5Y15DRAFT_373354 [Xylariaceae sp. FL0016]